jgi:hypothetical protein
MEDENLELEYPMFSMGTVVDGDDFAIKYRTQIAESVHLAIKRMIQYSLDEVPVFGIENTDSVFVLGRDEMVNAVDGCIAYYMEEEAYEICAELNHLKASL